MTWLTEIDGRLLLTEAAQLVTAPDQLPAEMAAEFERAAGNDKLMWLTGRFVEAEQANVNGAYWATEDLAWGERTVVHAPVNYLHRHQRVIGTFTDSRLVRPQLASAESADNAGRPYLAVAAAVWSEFFPQEARILRTAAEQGQLFWSMECRSRTVRCESAGKWVGCGREFPFEVVYGQVAGQRPCECLQQRRSQRRFFQPRFNAGATIVPPVRPGWAGATAQVRDRVDQLAEQTFREAAAASDYDRDELLELMVQQLALVEAAAAS